MELFSEIHSRYFYIICEVLKAASIRKLTAKDIAAMVAQLGFTETPLALTPQLLNENGDGYYVLKEDPAGYTPVLKDTPQLMLTQLQKRWLKAVLQDKRFALFADEHERHEYDYLLSDIAPLYDLDCFITVDMANDGDDYGSNAYRTIFKAIMQAIRNKKIMLITYKSGKGNRLAAYFAPYKLEYSMKDDKFRLCAIRMLRGRMQNLYKLNLSRISSVQVMAADCPANLVEHLCEIRIPLPVEIEVTDERNGFERIFTQLSNFERVSEYDENTKTCVMKIYYYAVDELELVITLLSFGPVIRVIGPAGFKEELTGRILRQKQLINNF